MLELEDFLINANIRDTASFLRDFFLVVCASTVRDCRRLRDIYKGELDFLLFTCEQILHINMPSTRHHTLRNSV